MTILLPGWSCPNCMAFNGDAKEFLQKCRCCEFDRPVSQAPSQDPGERVRALEGALQLEQNQPGNKIPDTFMF